MRQIKPIELLKKQIEEDKLVIEEIDRHIEEYKTELNEYRENMKKKISAAEYMKKTLAEERMKLQEAVDVLEGNK